jgi:hypothetical protein
MKAVAYLVAYFLLWTDVPVPDGIEEQVPGLAEAIRAVAVDAEWIVPQEYIGFTESDCECLGDQEPLPIADQITFLRDLRNMLRSYPRVELLQAILSHDWVMAQVYFARHHIAEIQARRDCCTLDLRGWYDDWLTEAKDRLEFWDALREATCDASCWRMLWRRNALQTCVEKIGKDNLRRGVLPAPVPLWRFQRIP